MPNNTLTADFRMQAEAIEKLKQVTQGLGDAVRQVARDFQGVFAGMSQGTTPIPAPGVPLQFATPTGSSFYNNPATMQAMDVHRYAPFIQNPNANLSVLSEQQRTIAAAARQAQEQAIANAKASNDIGLARIARDIPKGASALMTYMDRMREPGVGREGAFAELSQEAISSVLSLPADLFGGDKGMSKELYRFQSLASENERRNRGLAAQDIAQHFKAARESQISRPGIFTPDQRMAAERDALLSGNRALGYDLFDVRRIQGIDATGLQAQAAKFIATNQASADPITSTLIDEIKKLSEALKAATKKQDESMQQFKEAKASGDVSKIAQAQQELIKVSAEKEKMAEAVADGIKRGGGTGDGGGGRFNIDTAKLSRWMQYGQGAAAMVSGIAGSISNVASMYYNPLIESEFKELRSYATVGEVQAGRMSELLNLRNPQTQLKYAPRHFLSASDMSGVMSKYMEPGAVEGMITRRLENTIARDRIQKVANLVEGVASATVSVGEIAGGVAAGGGTGTIAVAHGMSGLSRAITQAIATGDMGLVEKLKGGIFNNPNIAASERAALMSAIYQEVDEGQSNIAKSFAQKQIFMGYRSELYDQMRSGARSYGGAAYGYGDIFGAYFKDRGLRDLSTQFGMTPSETVGARNSLVTAFAGDVKTNTLENMLKYSYSGMGSLSDLGRNIQQIRLLTGGTGDDTKLSKILEDAISAGFDKASKPQEFVNAVLTLSKKLDLTDPTVMSKSLAAYGALTGNMDSRTLGQMQSGVYSYQSLTGANAGLLGMLKTTSYLKSGMNISDVAMYSDMTSAQATSFISQLTGAKDISDIKDSNLLLFLGGDLSNRDQVLSRLRAVESGEAVGTLERAGAGWAGITGDLYAPLKGLTPKSGKAAWTKGIGQTLQNLARSYTLSGQSGSKGLDLARGALVNRLRTLDLPQQDLNALLKELPGIAPEDISKAAAIDAGIEAPTSANYELIGGFLKKYNRPLMTDTGQRINVGDYEAYIETRQKASQQQMREGLVSEDYTALITNLEKKFASLSNVNLGQQELAAQAETAAKTNLDSQLEYLRGISENVATIKGLMTPEQTAIEKEKQNTNNLMRNYSFMGG